jgi:hypothetical protein
MYNKKCKGDVVATYEYIYDIAKLVDHMCATKCGITWLISCLGAS